MIIVEHKVSKCRYIMIGAGYGHARTSTPSLLFGRLKHSTTEDTHFMACLCDKTGDLAWCPSDDLCVLSLNGEAVTDCPGIATFEDHQKQQPNKSEPAEPEPMRCVKCDDILTSPVCPKCNPD